MLPELKSLFEMLDKEFPLGEEAMGRHSVTLEDGNLVIGHWTTGMMYRDIIIEETDMQMSASELVAAIKEAHKCQE